jgi:hypothetical protein
VIDLEEFNAAFFNGDFDEEVLYTPSGGQGKPVRAIDRKSTRLNSSHNSESRMPSSA